MNLNFGKFCFYHWKYVLDCSAMLPKRNKIRSKQSTYRDVYRAGIREWRKKNIRSNFVDRFSSLSIIAVGPLMEEESVGVGPDDNNRNRPLSRHPFSKEWE